MIPDETALIILFTSADVAKAKEKEIEKWIENSVFDEVKDEGQPTISVRWVITEKVVKGEVNVNSRLVARGFEEDTSDLKTRRHVQESRST